MKEFVVGVREVHTIFVTVEANNREEAKEKAESMIGDIDYPDVMYDYTLDRSHWTVDGVSDA